MNQRDSELSHGQTGSDTAASPRSTSGLSNSVSSTASELKDSAREIKDQAVDKARSMFSGQKDQAVGELSAVAQALHRTGSDLQSEHPTVGKFTHQTASKIESFVRTIEDKEPEQILSDVKRMARNNPAVFIGGAVALGFIAARFLKTSGPDDDFYGDPNSRPTYPGVRGYGYGNSRGLAYAEGYGYTERYGTSGNYGASTDYGTDQQARTSVGGRTDIATDSGIGSSSARSTGSNSATGTGRREPQ